MKCETLKEARKQARANVKFFGVPFVVFTDTSGNPRCESLSMFIRSVPQGAKVFKP